MASIIPAVLGENFREIEQKIGRVEGLAEWVHVDVMDGLFVDTYGWQAPEDLMEIGGKAKIEAHLMAEKPELLVEDWLPVADRVIVHIEAADNLKEILNKFAHPSVELGVAVKLETPLSDLDEWLDKLTHVQLMGIKHIGRQGEPFDETVVGRVSDLRKKFVSGTITVDGGVTLENGRKILDAGADMLVVGSALWKGDNVKEALEAFQAL